MGSIKIGIITIDYSIIISFIAGAILGIIAMLMLIFILKLASKANMNFNNKSKAELSEDEFNLLIENYLSYYKDEELRCDKSKILHCATLCRDLAIEISSKYYPDSKYPYLELTVDEALELINYLEQNASKIINKKIYKLVVNKIKISNLVEKGQKKKDKANELKRSNNHSKLDNVKKIFKNLVFESDISPVNIVLNKLATKAINIVGVELYKIYSKKLFDKKIDLYIDKIIDEDDSVEIINNDIIDYEYKQNYLKLNSSFKLDTIFDEAKPLKTGGKSC